jgi:hypothetical protein
MPHRVIVVNLPWKLRKLAKFVAGAPACRYPEAVTTAALAPPQAPPRRTIARPWESWEDELLADAQLPLKQAAEQCGRSYDAVRARVSALGLGGLRARAKAGLATAAGTASQATAATWEWTRQDEDQLILDCYLGGIVRTLAWKQLTNLPKPHGGPGRADQHRQRGSRPGCASLRAVLPGQQVQSPSAAGSESLRECSRARCAAGPSEAL